jgi:fatty-acyl-CoA synthase
VVPEVGASVTEEQVLALCRRELARFKVPKHVLFLTADELPKTPTGKVRKFELVQMAAESLAGRRPVVG